MSGRMGNRTYICGGDLRPGPRGTDCPDTLHDWPLPTGYGDASDVAARRLRKRWGNRRCPDCGLYGWVPPPDGPDTDGMDRGNADGETTVT